MNITQRGVTTAMSSAALEEAKSVVTAGTPSPPRPPCCCRIPHDPATAVALIPCVTKTPIVRSIRPT